MANHASETLNKSEPVVMSYDAGKKIGAMASDFTNKTSDYVKTSRDYVKENPTAGVAIAAAAGVVAGSLLTMALRSRH